MVCNVPLEFGIDILTFQIRVWTFLVVSLFEDLNSNFRHVKLSRPKQGLKIYMPMSFVLTGLILLPNLEATQKKNHFSIVIEPDLVLLCYKDIFDSFASNYLKIVKKIVDISGSVTQNFSFFK